MDQETAFLEALQGVALIETRGQQVNLTDLRGAIKVTLVRPEPLAPASPGPSGEPTEEPTEEPDRPPRLGRHRRPPRHRHRRPRRADADADTGGIADAGCLPDPAPTGRRDVRAGERRGTTVATIVYPAEWFTEIEPADVACRYFNRSRSPSRPIHRRWSRR